MKQSKADKFGTLIGFISGGLFILTGIIFPAEYSNIALWLESTGAAENYNKYVIQILRFFDLKSFVIVFGGTISATFIAFPFTKTIRSFKSIPKVFAADHAEEATQEIYDKSKIIAEKRFSGKRITNDDISGLENPFMRVYSSPKPTHPESKTIGVFRDIPQKLVFRLFCIDDIILLWQLESH